MDHAMPRSALDTAHVPGTHMPEDSLAALDHAMGLARRIAAIAATLKELSSDIGYATEEGLLDGTDTSYLTLYQIARQAALTAQGLVAQVLADCADEPALLGLTHHRAALEQAQVKLSLAFVLVGDCDDLYEDDSPNADPFL